MKLSTGVHSIYSALILLGLVLGLQACGGSSTPPPPADANPTGYYTGSAAVKESNNTTDLAISDIQILINGSRLMIMSDAQVVVYDGQMNITANDFTSTVNIYINGINTGTAAVSGTITEGLQITGTFTGTGLGNGTFTSTYSTLNNTASTALKIDNVTPNLGQWTCGVNEGVSTLVLDIDSTSAVITAGPAGDSVFDGCQVVGTIAPIASTSLFNVTISTINNRCAISAVESSNNGIYTGIATTKDKTDIGITSNERLVLTMSNGTYSTGDDCYFNLF